MVLKLKKNIWTQHAFFISSSWTQIVINPESRNAWMCHPNSICIILLDLKCHTLVKYVFFSVSKHLF